MFKKLVSVSVSGVLTYCSIFLLYANAAKVYAHSDDFQIVRTSVST